MIWFFTLALGFWCLLQQDRLNTLAHQLADLRREFLRAAPGGAVASASQPAAAPRQTLEPATVAETPPRLKPIALGRRPAEPAIPAALRPAVQTPEPVSANPSRVIADWMSENGLAWIGGGALVLGGLFLVAYAAQRGLFGPPMRVGAGVGLGLVALGAGEALRRGVGGREPNRLVAALVTGAGASILFAAIWAAYRLYGYLPFGGAVLLLAGVAFGLLALALLHGEAIALLAIGGAYLIPVVCASTRVPVAPLDIFVGLVLATGTAAASARRWTQAQFLALIGAGAWTLSRLWDADVAGGAALGLAAPVLVLACALILRLRKGAPDPWADLPVQPFTSAIVMASLIAAVATLLGSPKDLIWGALALVGIGACITAAEWAHRGHRLLLLSPVIAIGLVALVGHRNVAQVPWVIVAALAAAGSGLVAARLRDGERQPAVIGAAGLAVTMTLSIALLARVAGGLDWAIDGGVATLLAAGALALAARSKDAKADLAIGAWVAAAAEVAGLSLHAGLDVRWTPIAYGLLGLALAGLALRLRWRGFAESAAVACFAGFAALLQPKIAWAAITGLQAAPTIAAVTAGAVLAQVATWLTLRAKRDASATAEAASTMAVITGLLGAFLTIQTLDSAGGRTAMLGDYVQASVRTLLLIAAGLMLALRGAATPLGRYRAPTLLALGVIHGLLLEALFLHPWWGLGGRVMGPPIFDSLFLGLFVPALLLAETARRARTTGSAGIPSLVAGLLFLVIWAITETRRLFHGPDLLAGAFSHAEVAAYGVIVLGLALVLDLARRRLRASRRAEPAAVDTIVSGAMWVCMIGGLSLTDYLSAPWWGPLQADLAMPAVFFTLHIVAAALTAGLVWMARRSPRKALSVGALVATGVETFVLLTLAVRFTFHGNTMAEPLREASLETWAFSAVWALYGLSMLLAGAMRRDTPTRLLGLALLLLTAAKVFLFDLGHLGGVVRAASFLALGVVLLVAALAARRFSSTAPPRET